MRKNIIALMLVLPLLFVFVVFSSAKTASLGVPVSANGIEIVNKPESGYRIDLSTYGGEYAVRARVTPDAASNRGFVYRAEGAVAVDESGNILAESTGEGKITVVSKDGGYEDSVRVVVYATEPYDFSVALYALGGTENLLEEGNAHISTGSYVLSCKTLPEGSFGAPKITETEGFVFPDEAAGTLLLPFSGDAGLTLSLEGKQGGKTVTITKTVSLSLKKPLTGSGFVVNGGNSVIVLDKDSTGAVFYVEGETVPQIMPDPHIQSAEVEELAAGKYRVAVAFAGAREDFSLTLAGGEEAEPVSFSFEEFDFTVRSDLPVQLAGEASVLVNAPVSFYAVPSVQAGDITYEWRLSEPDKAALECNESGSVCRITAKSQGAFTLEVRAYRHGALLDLFEKRIEITAVERVTAIQFAETADLGLEKRRAVAGERYENGTRVANTLELHPCAFGAEGEAALENLEFFSSDESVATVALTEKGTLFVAPQSTGSVIISAEWRGNDSFAANVRAELPLLIVKEGVEVSFSPELYAAAGEGRAVVLAQDILLGTDENGIPLPHSEREKLLGGMPSTYNVEYYKNTGGEARVRYCLELKNDLYGNGHTLNAELFTTERDGAVPRWFRGPLCFVKFGEVASVAAQDNIAFLIRTDGVTLRNATLVGCGDGWLTGEGGYDLSRLNTVGTTLEVNANANILNCRVRNGRNVVRVYGGNTGGDGYFVDSLDGTKIQPVRVKIEGCILSQGREFLLKIGANRALRATKENGVEPDLQPYKQFADDEYFLSRYLQTEVTLKDSVLETSGLFCVGIESNFSGELLFRDGEDTGLKFEGWQGTGGTSFASLLRLVGDVRLYDWKDISLIDSSTLITTELPELKLDIAAMLDFVAKNKPSEYGGIFAEEGGNRFVHGGIAFYGGGKNYSQVLREELDPARNDFNEYRINIGVLGEAEGNVGYQGQILPLAAGTQDFRFLLYRPKNYSVQLKDAEDGAKYDGVKPVSLP